MEVSNGVAPCRHSPELCNFSCLGIYSIGMLQHFRWLPHLMVMAAQGNSSLKSFVTKGRARGAKGSEIPFNQSLRLKSKARS